MNASHSQKEASSWRHWAPMRRWAGTVGLSLLAMAGLQIVRDLTGWDSGFFAGYICAVIYAERHIIPDRLKEVVGTPGGD